MSDSTIFPYPAGAAGEAPLTEAEMAPIQGAGGAIEALLRRPRGLIHAFGQGGHGGVVMPLVLAALGCALLYGVVAGTFSGGVQIYAAPLKIAGGLLVSAALCLPSLYIFNCLSGSAARLGEVAGMLAAALSLSLLLLFSFAPVAWVFSQSTESVGVMGLFHVIFWLISLFFGGRLLMRGMRLRGARSMGVFWTWLMFFLLVSLQMATALRPIIGKAPTIFPQEKRFFISHWTSCFGDEKPKQ